MVNEQNNSSFLKKSLSKQSAQQISENYESENPIFEIRHLILKQMFCKCKQTLKPQIIEANICCEHGEEISLFCNTERILCCVQCVYQSQIHKKHNVIPIKQALHNLREDNLIFINSCREKVSQIDEAIKNCQYNKNKLQQLVNQYKTMVQQEFQKLIQTIQKREEEALSHIQNFHDSSYQDYESKQENLQFLKNCIKEYSELDRAQESVQQETTIYLYSIQNMLKNSIKNFSIKTPVIKCDSIEIVEMNNRHQIQNELQNLGKSKVKNYLASAIIQMQQTSAKKQPTHSNSIVNNNLNSTINNTKNLSRSRSPLQQKEIQQQATPKAIKKSPNQKSHLNNVKFSSKDYQWKEMTNKMNNLAEGISQAQRPISPINTEAHQKERMVKRLTPSRSSLNFSSNKQISQATPKQKQISLQTETVVAQNNVKKVGLSPAPSQKTFNKGLEIKTNTGPSFNENISKRSVTPNSFNKQQGLVSNLGYSSNFKSQITPKRSSGYNPFINKAQAKKTSNYQSRGSQKGDENYQTTTSQNNNFEQNPISEIKDKVEQHSNIQENNHNRNRSESPMYINVNEFQAKTTATYKSQHDMKALKQNNSNSNLKSTPIQSSVGATISGNIQSTQLNQQQKSLSYQNLHQIRHSADLKLIQNTQEQLQQASQNSTPTLKAEKVYTPTSQNLLQSSQTGGFSQLTSNVYTNESPLISSQQNEENHKKIQSGLNLDQTSYFQQLGQEKDRLTSAQLIEQQYFIDQNIDQNIIRRDIQASYQQQQSIIQQQQEINNNHLQQIQVIPHQQQNIPNTNQQYQNQQFITQQNQEQQVVSSQQLQKSYGQQGSLQILAAANLAQKQQQSINEVDKTNDTLFQNQRSSIYNFQHEAETFSPFKQQNQLSPIAKQQINSQYLENQSNIQSPPTSYFPQQFNIPNQVQNEAFNEQIADKQFSQTQQIAPSFNNSINKSQTQNIQYQQYQQNDSQNYIQQNVNIGINNSQTNKNQEFQIKTSLPSNESQNRNGNIEQEQQLVNLNRSQQNNQSLKKLQSFEGTKEVRQIIQPVDQVIQNQDQAFQQQQYVQQYNQQQQQYPQIEQNQQQQLVSSGLQNQTSSSQNDNNVLNSQFSFTPSNQANNVQDQKQEQVTVFNTINNGVQYQLQQQQFNQRGEYEFNQIAQNNMYQQVHSDNSFNLPTPTQISFQNQEQIENIQTSYIERTNNSTSNNSNIQQQQIFKTQQQNFAPTFPHTNNSNNNSNSQYILIQQQEQLQEANTTQVNNTVEPQISQNVISSSIFSDSQIFTYSLQINHQCTKILPPNIKKAKLLYRLTEDGANSQIFHRKCDGQGPTITFVKANGEHIFGYYLPISFCRSDQYSTTDKCYIFTVQNSQNIPPTKFEIRPEKKFISIYQNTKNPCLGSTLNGKQDLIINFDNPEKSCSNLGYAYKIDSNIASDKILAGQYTDWNITEIEIYSLTV